MSFSHATPSRSPGAAPASSSGGRTRGAAAPLRISRPGDPEELEAERVAGALDSRPTVRPRPGLGGALQRRCRSCREEEKDELQRSPSGAAAPGGFQPVSGTGRPLPASARSWYESRLGWDFSQVRVHAGAEADASARSAGSLAYTRGSDIVFAAGRYDPDSPPGRRLLGHELVHVIQQAQGEPRLQRMTEDQCKANGCAPQRCGSIESDLTRALGYLDAALAAINASPRSELTRTALRWYFRTEEDVSFGKWNVSQYDEQLTIAGSLQGMRDLLARAQSQGEIFCTTESPCGGIPYIWPGAAAYAQSGIHLCRDEYFRHGARTRAEILIHEAAHEYGFRSDTSDIYAHSSKFRTLSMDEARRNADCYALFASAIADQHIPVTLVLAAGASGGVARATDLSDPVWWASIHVDATFQHPTLHIFNPTLRLSETLIGTRAGESAGAPTNARASIGLLAGLRIEQPRPQGGGPYLSILGGPTINLERGKDSAVGAEVALAAGYRWSHLDLGFGATYRRDPLAPEGRQDLIQFGPTITIPFQNR